MQSKILGYMREYRKPGELYKKCFGMASGQKPRAREPWMVAHG